MKTTQSLVGLGLRERYRRALGAVLESGVPFLVGGGYALEYYTGIRGRPTRDLDLFIRHEDARALQRGLLTRGFEMDVTFPHWLAKISLADTECIDVIWSSGNGVARVDDAWFTHSVPAAVFGRSVRLCPPEEMIWSKAFIMERERYDGADIAHLIRACHGRLHWQRLLDRFGPHWRVLLSHLVLFGYIYPGEPAMPAWVSDQLVSQLAAEPSERASHERLCRGGMLSRGQYLTDLHHWGYVDTRLQPHGTLTAEEVARWTEGIANDGDIDHANCRRG